MTEGNFRRTLRLAVTLFLVMVIVSPAQRLDGTLRGTVTDPSGAVVEGAAVSVSNAETGVTQNTVTTNNGTYIFPNLLVAKYTVTVTKQGFQKSVRRDVEVRSNQVSEANAKLTVGADSEAVEVVAGGEVIQTTTSQLSNTFSTREVLSLPTLPQGSVLELAVLAPNTTTQQGGVLGQGGSVGGARPRMNSFTIDGTDNNDVSVTGPLVQPIGDSIAEFTLITNQFTAEYGNGSGGQFNVVTKSGTNDVHGEAHWFTNNRNLNAVDNLVGAAIENGDIDGKPRYDFNRLGTSVGGPIFKNKLFFFGAYEYQTEGREATGVTVLAPTAAGLAALQANAANTAVLDILSQFPAASGATGQECINGTGATCTGGTLVDVGEIQLFAPDFFNQHDFNTNIDANLGKHQLRARFLYNRYRSPQVNADTPLPQFTGALVSDNRKIILSDVWTINEQFVNDFRLNYSRNVADFTIPSQFSNFPNAIVDTLGLNVGPDGNLPQGGTTNIYQLVNNVSYARGSHVWKGGFEVRDWISPGNFLPRGRGEWDYANLNSLVNDLVPDGLNGALRGAGTGAFSGNQIGIFWFFQDDWKIHPRLTLNLGLRYEWVSVPKGSDAQQLNDIATLPGVFEFRKPKSDTNNFSPRVGFAWDPFGDQKWAVRGGAMMSFDKEPQNFPLLNLPPQLQTEQNPALTCSGSSGPAPAWCVSGTGFLAGGGLLQTNVPPTTQAEARSATGSIIVDQVKPKTYTWSLSVQRALWKSASFEARYLGTAGVSLPVQTRLNTITGFDSGLTGLPVYFSASEIPATVALAAEDRADWVGHSTCATTCALRYINDGFDGGFLTAFTPNGHSTYHSGSVDFIQRSFHGIYFRTNYTWAKSMDNATNELFSSRVNPRRPADPYHLSTERGRSTLDINHKAAISWVWDVPKVNTDSGFGRAVLNGWQINGTWIGQTGQPITPLSGTDMNGDLDNAGDRAIFNPNGVARTGTGVDFVCRDPGTGATSVGASATACGGSANVVGYVARDSSAEFVAGGLGAVSTARRNSVSSPGLNITNLSVFKNVNVNERAFFQFRVEMFNVFNHRSFTLANPGVFGVTSNALSATYANVATSQFLDETQFSGGNRTIQLGLKFTF
jgi:hypothetical protein